MKRVPERAFKKELSLHISKNFKNDIFPQPQLNFDQNSEKSSRFEESDCSDHFKLPSLTKIDEPKLISGLLTGRHSSPSKDDESHNLNSGYKLLVMQKVKSDVYTTVSTSPIDEFAKETKDTHLEELLVVPEEVFSPVPKNIELEKSQTQSHMSRPEPIKIYLNDKQWSQGSDTLVQNSNKHKDDNTIAGILNKNELALINDKCDNNISNPIRKDFKKKQSGKTKLKEIIDKHAILGIKGKSKTFEVVMNALKKTRKPKWERFSGNFIYHLIDLKMG